MPKILDNFVKEVKKLSNYLILKEEKDEYLIIGTKIDVKLHKEVRGTFTNLQQILEKSFYVYFRIAFTQKEAKLKDYDYLPTLFYDNALIFPPKPVKDAPVKKYNAERVTVKPDIYKYDEFDMLSELDKFINKTYHV